MKLSVGEGFQDKLSNLCQDKLFKCLFSKYILRILIYTCLIQILF